MRPPGTDGQSRRSPGRGRRPVRRNPSRPWRCHSARRLRPRGSRLPSGNRLRPRLPYPEDRQQAGRAVAEQPGGEQGQRIQVVVSTAQPPVQAAVRAVVRAVVQGADPLPGRDSVALGDHRAHRLVRDAQRWSARTVQLHRNDPASRHAPREGDPARARGPHGLAGRRREIDTAVPRSVRRRGRLPAAHHHRPHPTRPVHRPGPCPRLVVVYQTYRSHQPGPCLWLALAHWSRRPGSCPGLVLVHRSHRSGVCPRLVLIRRTCRTCRPGPRPPLGPVHGPGPGHGPGPVPSHGPGTASSGCRGRGWGGRYRQGKQAEQQCRPRT